MLSLDTTGRHVTFQLDMNYVRSDIKYWISVSYLHSWRLHSCTCNPVRSIICMCCAAHLLQEMFDRLLDTYSPQTACRDYILIFESKDIVAVTTIRRASKAAQAFSKCIVFQLPKRNPLSAYATNVAIIIRLFLRFHYWFETNVNDFCLQHHLATKSGNDGASATSLSTFR